MLYGLLLGMLPFQSVFPWHRAATLVAGTGEKEIPVCSNDPDETFFRVMFYNVENAFDCRHDTLKDDGEFLPGSDRKWTYYRYWKKLNALTKVIAAAGEESFPALIGCCEVENDSVLFDWTCRSSLRTMGYRYVMTDSPDRRGIDVALLYLPERFRLLSHREIPVPSERQGLSPTRNMLHVTGQVLTGDTLHVIVVHLPSRSGNTRDANRHRRLAAQVLRGELESLYAASESSRILVMGDMNATRKERLFEEVLPLSPAGGEGLMYLPREGGDIEGPVQGSYRYKGEWETIDHIWVSPSLMDTDASFHTADGMFRIFARPFMWEEDASYGGVRPYRTYLGTFYKGGYSDHFPVVLDFIQR